MKLQHYIFLIIVFICQSAFTQEIWVDQKPTSRSYFSVRKVEGGIYLKQYSQKKGEYQEKISERYFNTEKGAIDYIKSFKSFKGVVKLESWPVHEESVGLVQKKLGDKRARTIWEAREQWNDEWELKFATWIQQNASTDFYQKYNIPTDCADAIVGFRWIFARINSLPAANTLEDSDTLFGNFSNMRKWDNLATSTTWYEDQLFMSALKYIMDLTSTRTVIKDGYAVRIDRKSLLAGNYIVTQVNRVGHAKIISETHYNVPTELPFYTLASTVPRIVRPLVRESFVDQEWPNKGTKELLAFRWPVVNNSRWTLKPVTEHSRYSPEQFDESLKKSYPAFITFILSRVKDNYDPVKLVEFGVREIVDYTKLRIDVVNKGYAACGNRICTEGSGEYDDWSTNSRDEKLLKKFIEMDKLVKEFEPLSPGLYEFWVNQLRNTIINIDGLPLSLSNVRYLFERKFTSPNPNVTPKERWGLDASKVVVNWLAKAETLMNQRKTIMAQISSPCPGACLPKSDAWYKGNTYLVDTSLNKLYVEVGSYCNVIGDNNCSMAMQLTSPKSLTFSGKSKTLADWFDTIPYFHSDPRVSFERRWGTLSGNLKGYALPYFERVSISKTSIALLDEKKLINLKSGANIYESPKDTRLVLTEEGAVYQFMDTEGSMKKGFISGDSISFSDLSDPQNVLSQYRDRPISYIEDEGRPVFRKVTPVGILAFRVRGSTIEPISKYTGRSMQIGPLLSLVQSPTTMTFVDLDRNQIFEFTLPMTDTFKDMNKMKISSYSYPVALTEYHDNDWGLHYMLKLNLETKTWTILNLGLIGAFELRFSSARLNKMLITLKPGAEFPELYAVDVKGASPIVTRQLNNLLSAIEYGEHVYFIQSQGSQWNQNLTNKLMDWTSTVQNFPGNYGNPTFLTKSGVYFNGNEARFVTFDQTKNFKMPKSLIPATDFHNIQKGGLDVIPLRFDTSYGDYWNMGYAVSLSKTNQNLKTLEEELSPQFGLYAWISKGDLINERWQETFMSSSVKSGTLVSTGKNMGMWWGSPE